LTPRIGQIELNAARFKFHESVKEWALGHQPTVKMTNRIWGSSAESPKQSRSGGKSCTPENLDEKVRTIEMSTIDSVISSPRIPTPYAAYIFTPHFGDPVGFSVHDERGKWLRLPQPAKGRCIQSVLREESGNWEAEYSGGC
jgi:hypothetical protein